MQLLSPRMPGPRLVMLGIAAFALAALAPAVMEPFHIRVGQAMFLGAGLALSWYILGGFAAYYSFGHTAFVGVGAFAAALWQASIDIDGGLLTMAAALAAGGLACAIIAALIAYPILRLRGHYFTIAMLALALVLGEVVNSFDVFGGSIGVGFRPVEPGWVSIEAFYYYLLLLALGAAVLIALAIKRSRLGYGLLAIREDEDAAEMLGVATFRHKATSFVISAAMCGVFGAILAYNLGYITTNSVFRGQLSLDMIVFCLLGGMSSIAGPIIGAVVLTLLTKVLLSDLLDLHLAVTGLIIIVIVLAAPNGIIGAIRSVARPGSRERRRAGPEGGPPRLTGEAGE